MKTQPPRRSFRGLHFLPDQRCRELQENRGRHLAFRRECTPHPKYPTKSCNLSSREEHPEDGTIASQPRVNKCEMVQILPEQDLEKTTTSVFKLITCNEAKASAAQKKLVAYAFEIGRYLYIEVKYMEGILES